MTTKITGIVRDLEGQPLANSMLRFERRSGVRAQAGATVVPRVVNAKTDAGGNISVELYPGEYRAQADRGSGALTFSVGVPEDVVQVDLQDLLDQVPAITPMWASETRQARDDAVEAAESTAGSAEAAEDSASSASASADAASDSAGTAQVAEGGAVDARDKAQEWAENPEDDEVEAGAFSAKHHAAKAAQSAALSNRVIYVATIADLQALNTDPLQDGQPVIVTNNNLSYRFASGATVIPDLPDWIPGRDVYPDHFKENSTPGTTDMSDAIQSAMDWLSQQDDLDGDVLNFGPQFYQCAGLVMRSRVHLKGAGRGATILRQVVGSDQTLLTIPKEAEVFGWSSLSFRGLATDNALGSGILFEEALVGGSAGREFSAKSLDDTERSYKHCVAYDFAVGFFPEDGIYIDTRNFKIFFDSFTVYGCKRDGMHNRSSDTLMSNFYIERNERCGLRASGSNNKYTTGKVIWSGVDDPSEGNIRVLGSNQRFVSVEAQDAYTDGWSIGGSNNHFIACTSSRNGYEVDEEGDRISSRVHADFRFRSGANNLRLIACRAYNSAEVLKDGNWSAEYPYFFDDFNSDVLAEFDVEFDESTYNDVPNVMFAGLASSNLFRAYAGEISGGTAVNLSPISPDGNEAISFFRDSNGEGFARLEVFVPGTPSLQHWMRADSGAVEFCRQGGNFLIGPAASGFRFKEGAGVVVPRLPDNPSSPSTGEVYYNTTDDKLRLRVPGAWVDLN